MASGLPVIVCERGGPGANVDSTCALRLGSESPSQLARDCATAIRRLVIDPSMRMQMGEAGRHKVQSTREGEHRADQMSALYEEVVAGR